MHIIDRYVCNRVIELLYSEMRYSLYNIVRSSLTYEYVNDIAIFVKVLGKRKSKMSE